MRRLIQMGLAVVIACMFGACATAQGPGPASTQAKQEKAFGAKVDAYARNLVATYHIPGAAVLVQKDGRTIASANLGHCNVEFQIPTSDRCIFHLASSSKIFAGTAIMRLAQQGRLKLDDPISQYLDALPENWRSATIRQIMNHTSGIPNFFEAPDYERLSPGDRWNLTPQQLIAFAASRPMDGKPGEKWTYAQAGPMLAGLIVERISGQSFAGHMQKTIFGPLAMTHTAYGDSSVLIRNRSATAYRWINGELRHHQYPFEPPTYPAGGLNSSAQDIARFFTALNSNALLTDASKADMWERARLTSGETRGYALGWDVQDHGGWTVVQHSGAGSVWLGYVPEQKLTIIFLTNLNGVSNEFERSLKPQNPIFGILDLYRAP